MFNVRLPRPDDLPSPGRLRRSALIALGVGVVLLLVVVLPAEKGIDPTGLGRIIGLEEMGEVKAELRQELEDDAAFLAASRAADSLLFVDSAARAHSGRDGVLQPARSDLTTVTLTPHMEKEIKLAMRKGGRVVYAWWTAGGKVDYEVRWDSPNGPPGSDGYERGRKTSAKAGMLEADLAGLHVWHWRSVADADVIITLRTKGDYIRVIE